MFNIVTVQGDRLDQLCYKHYGTVDMLEKVLEANPALAQQPQPYQSGITIIMPDKPEAKQKTKTALW